MIDQAHRQDADATSPTVTAQEQGIIPQDSWARLLEEGRDFEIRGVGFFVTEHFEQSFCGSTAHFNSP